MLEDKGSELSGNYGHAGRPGLVGGSAPSGSSNEFSEEQINALKDYGDVGYIRINKSLRRSEIDEKTSAQINAIDSVLSLTKTDRDLTLYRGIDLAIGTASQRNISDFQVGQIVTDKGFVSASLDREAIEQFVGKGESVIMSITLPKGRQALFMSERPGRFAEKEVLLPRNLPMRVREISKHPNAGPEGRPLTIISVDVE